MSLRARVFQLCPFKFLPVITGTAITALAEGIG